MSNYTKDCPTCGSPAEFNRLCAAYVCATPSCHDNHVGLARCYCGWSISGGDGRAELVEMGEQIEEEE